MALVRSVHPTLSLTDLCSRHLPVADQETRVWAEASLDQFPSPPSNTPLLVSLISMSGLRSAVRSMTALERVTGSEIGSRHPLDTLPPTYYPLEKQSPECNPRVSVRVRAPSVGRIGSGVWVSTSFQFFALRMLLYSSGGFSLRYNHRARMCPYG